MDADGPADSIERSRARLGPRPANGLMVAV
jgi:hypothetical protein